MEERFKTQEQLNIQYNVIAMRNNLLPIKVSKFYLDKVKEEVDVLGGTEGPLHRIVYPTNEKISLFVHGETDSFVDDLKNSPVQNCTIIKKYKDRVLFLPTFDCVANCQYCFRQNIIGANSTKINYTDELDKLIDFIHENPGIKEVILTGGDPLTLNYEELKDLIVKIKTETNIESIRVHTRALAYNPLLLNEKIQMLFGEFNVRIVFHIVHPYELCSVVTKQIRLLQSHGIRCYNQFPMLRKINDDKAVIAKLLKILDELNVRNLSIFVPDPIKYSACHRMPLKRLFSIVDEINLCTPSWINSTRVVLDTVYGKVRRENIKMYDKEKKLFIFERGGRDVLYYDFPEEYDSPGDVNTMLWKG